MNDADLLAALIAERLDYRWFKSPPKEPRTPASINVPRDDEVTCARRRRALEDDMSNGRWVLRRGVKVWEAAHEEAAG